MNIIQLGKRRFLANFFDNSIILPNNNLKDFNDISIIVDKVSKDLFGDFEFPRDKTYIVNPEILKRKVIEDDLKRKEEFYRLLPKEISNRLSFEEFLRIYQPLNKPEQKLGLYDTFNDGVYSLNMGYRHTISTCIHENMHRAVSYSTGLKDIDAHLSWTQHEETLADDASFRCCWLLFTLEGDRNNKRYIKETKNYHSRFNDYVKKIRSEYNKEKMINIFVNEVRNLLKN